MKNNAKKTNVKLDKDSEAMVVTKEEKIEYCDKKYGKGNYEFLSKDEFVEIMKFLRGM